jgi:broad-specificity NMP kinase
MHSRQSKVRMWSRASTGKSDEGMCGALHRKIGKYKGAIIQWIQCDSCDMDIVLVLRIEYFSP